MLLRSYALMLLRSYASALVLNVCQANDLCPVVALAAYLASRGMPWPLYPTF